jgi:hypothetical protein
VHCHGIASLYEVRLPSATVEEALKLIVRDMLKNSRVADLVLIHVENGKNCTVCLRIKEFV